MCGINGIVHRDPSHPMYETDLLAMRDVLVHRGPDDAGHYLAPGVGLGSRRLAILDLSERGRMPMGTPDGRFWITYNGEVYNFRDLRLSLAGRGWTFRTETDTEVVLALYATEGPAMLERLNGMFAMAIWDARDRSLFLARDRLGIKPLFYAERRDTLCFASEEKALFAAGIEARFDPATWEELLCFRYVAGERTPYAGVMRLLPGHWLLWKDGRIAMRRWWNLGEKVRAARPSPPADPVAWFRETFDDAVALRRISDVPVGVLLSGGLDSSSVAATLALQAGGGVASFTVRFPEPEFDEGPRARQVAERWNLERHELTVPTDSIPERLAAASLLNDEPLAHGSDLHMLAISHYAKPRVTVLLSGEGADETHGGYVRYRPLRHPWLLSAARPIGSRLSGVPGLPRRVQKLARFLALGSLESAVLFNACDVLPADLEGIGLRPQAPFEYRRRVLAEAVDLYPGDPARQAMFSDQHTFLCSILDLNDRMTMGASIECRVPFLDYRLVEGLGALPSTTLLGGGQGKPLVRRAMADRVPAAVLRNRKWGFTAPWSRYLRQVPALRDAVGRLPRTPPIDDGPFDSSRLRNAVKQYLDGQDRHEPLIRELVMIAAWHRACITGRAAVEPPLDARTPVR
jgi:asparagine synthase (glutamine-hydrolysing)